MQARTQLGGRGSAEVCARKCVWKKRVGEFGCVSVLGWQGKKEVLGGGAIDSYSSRGRRGRVLTG